VKNISPSPVSDTAETAAVGRYHSLGGATMPSELTDNERDMAQPSRGTNSAVATIRGGIRIDEHRGGIPRARVSLRDLLAEAGAAIRHRPGRSILTALGTVIGVGAFVATTGLAQTARAQVSAQFDALKASEVRVEDAIPDGTDPFPSDVDTRLQRLNGVRHAGLYWTIQDSTLVPRALPSRVGLRNDSQIGVIAATPGAVQAALPTLTTGRLFDSFHNERGEQVAVLGSQAARRLGITRVDNQPAVFVGETAFTVIGILSDVQRNPDLLLSVIIPETTARKRFNRGQAQYKVLIDVSPGAARLIGAQAALALRPQQPDRLQVLVPPDPKTLRRNVERDVTGLFYALAGLALLVGTIGIANTTLVAVIERRSEIGLRRALGAKPRHIASQIIAESATLGLFGGIAGTAIGILSVIAVSIGRQWTTTMNPSFAFLAPLAGLAAGVIAGIQPAVAATRTEPAGALRAG
jgi:putative ABC transport system permease protein